MDPQDQVKLLVGAATCVGGIVLVLRHLHYWRIKTDATNDQKEKRYLWNLLRRRALTSSCISLLGFVIALLSFNTYWKQHPAGWGVLVGCSLALTLMIFCLAVFDMLTVGNAIRTDRDKTNTAAKELAREYHRLKKKAADQAAVDAKSDSAADQG